MFQDSVCIHYNFIRKYLLPFFSVMESSKQILNKATDAYINIFTGTRHQRKKHINDNEYLITKVESELRLINVGVVTSSIFMGFLMVLIGVLLFYDFYTDRIVDL